MVWLSQPEPFSTVSVYRNRNRTRIGLMRLMVLGFVLLIGVVVAPALFLGARSAHSDVISSEMHEIDANTQSLDI
jgi:hypothetical protein